MPCSGAKKYYLYVWLCQHNNSSHVRLSSFSDLNRNLYVKWEKLGVKLKRLRQQVLKSLTFAFSFEKVRKSIPLVLFYCFSVGCFSTSSQ